MQLPEVIRYAGGAGGAYPSGDFINTPDHSRTIWEATYDPVLQWQHFYADGSIWLHHVGARFAIRLDSDWDEQRMRNEFYSEEALYLLPGDVM